MKKLLKIMIAMVMVFCLSVTAFAAASTSVVVEVSGAKDASGNAVEVTAEETSVKLDAAEVVAAVEEAMATLTDVTTEAKAEDLSIAYLKDLTSEVLPVTIAFTVEGAGANDTVYAMHYNGTKWECVGEGKGSDVSFTFTSLSPVALVLQKNTETPAAPSTGSDTTAPSTGTTEDSTAATPSTGTTGTDTAEVQTSPKTGEGLTMVYAGGVLLLAGAVALAARKKEKEA